ncbi:hypothetical protein [Limnospira platensis]|uniref:hypothetical protein n=1 Tax=Limnospira platensis TaxID=118562 RepID=UPI0021AB050B|nr:hypothetical protein APLC1_5272 [Arthrospira platensis C1]
MLDITLNWKPDPQTLTQLVQVAIQEQKSLETLLDEAIAQYLQANLTPNPFPHPPLPPTPFSQVSMTVVPNFLPKQKPSSPQKFNPLRVYHGKNRGDR